MRLQKPRAIALYNSACAECKAGGADLAPDDYAWLWDAAQRAIDSGHYAPDFIEPPVVVGNVTLYPRTIGAWIWWKNYGLDWYGNGSDEDQIVALAWMLANAKDAAMFERMTSKWRCTAAILGWQLKVAASVTFGELAWGITKVFGGRDPVESGSGEKQGDAYLASSVDWGEIVARLCSAYHQRPEYFLWQIGENVAMEMLKNIPAENGRRHEDDEMKAFAEFREVVRVIKARAKVA